jgi:hypothetical protein
MPVYPMGVRPTDDGWMRLPPPPSFRTWLLQQVGRQDSTGALAVFASSPGELTRWDSLPNLARRMLALDAADSDFEALVRAKAEHEADCAEASRRIYAYFDPLF